MCVGVNKRFMGTPTRRVSEPGLGDDPGNQVYYRVIGPIYIYIYDGDTEPETLVTRAYNYRRWRIAQTIEKLGFSLCFLGLIHMDF